MMQPDAAVAIVRARGTVESVLLIQRTEREDDPWSGHWSFPGGRRDPEDPDLLHTALRELEEECGIRLDRERMERALPHTLARRNTGPYLLVAPFLFGVDDELATVLEPMEAAAALWVPLRDLRDLARHTLRPVPGRPPEILFPAVDLKGELPMELKATPLWGFTYRLIADWLGLTAPSAGFEEALRVLQFLESQGVTLQREWQESEQGAKVAVVRGAIPVAAIVEHFSKASGCVPGVNCLEVLPDSVRIIGPEFEEYWIRGSG